MSGLGVICPGCGAIVPRPVVRHGRCPDCQQAGRPLNVRVWKSRRFRERTRPAVLRRDEGRCCRCGRPGNVVDHVLPIGTLVELGRDPFDPSECQTLCARCSGKKSMLEDAPRLR